MTKDAVSKIDSFIISESYRSSRMPCAELLSRSMFGVRITPRRERYRHVILHCHVLSSVRVSYTAL